MAEITGINTIARLAEGMLAEAREALAATIEQENQRDVVNDPIAYYCARVRRAIMEEARRNPEGIRRLCDERGMGPGEADDVLGVMRVGAFVISKRADPIG